MLKNARHLQADWGCLQQRKGILAFGLAHGCRTDHDAEDANSRPDPGWARYPFKCVSEVEGGPSTVRDLVIHTLGEFGR